MTGFRAKRNGPKSVCGKLANLDALGQTLMVMLKWIDSRKHRQAAEQLCHKLNQIGVRLVGGLDVNKLSFHIARYP